MRKTRRDETSTNTYLHLLRSAQVIKILKSNSRVCGTVGSLFSFQLEIFFLDMLNVYKVYSERISQAIAEQGPIATKHALIRSMRSAKKEVLKLLSTFVEKSGEPESGPASVAAGFLPPLLGPILDDYNRNISGARDPEVLSLMSVVVSRLKVSERSGGAEGGGCMSHYKIY